MIGLTVPNRLENSVARPFTKPGLQTCDTVIHDGVMELDMYIAKGFMAGRTAEQSNAIRNGVAPPFSSLCNLTMPEPSLRIFPNTQPNAALRTHNPRIQMSRKCSATMILAMACNS